MKKASKKYSPEAIAAVEDIIETLDVEGLIEHATRYISVYHEEVMSYVLDCIEDSEEFTREEIEYLSERVKYLMEKFV
jgi:hypothetical protein